MLDTNCVEDHLVLLGDYYTPIRLLLHSCIRSFRAWLWVTVFATMISAIVMICCAWKAIVGSELRGRASTILFAFI